MKEFFLPRRFLYKCKECKDNHSHIAIKQKIIKALPKYLILYFDSFTKDDEHLLRSPPKNIPEVIDLQELVKKQKGMKIKEGDSFKYALNSFISVTKAMNLNDVQF